MTSKTIETNYTLELAVELYRKGEYGEAKTVLTDALKESTRADALVSLTNNLALVEGEEGKYTEALKLYLEVAPLIDSCENDLNRANFHFGLARTYRQVATGEKLPSFYDRALIEYEAARYYFELSGQLKRVWMVENNIAFLKIKLNRSDESYAHIERARGILIQHSGAQERLAEVDDTLALVCLAEGKGKESYLASSAAVLKMQNSDELKLKASILETHLKTTAAYLREVNQALKV